MVAPNERSREDGARLEALLDRAGRRAGLSFEELRELARLYRLHTARLSKLRQRGADPEAVTPSPKCHR